MSNKYILELSGENIEIAHTEIRYIQNAFKNFEILQESERYILIEGSYNNAMDSAFTNYISRVIDENQDYTNFIENTIPEGFFYVRVSEMPKTETMNVESEIGKNLGGKGRISFKHPDFIIRVIFMDKWYLCQLIYERNKKSFEERRAPMRPFFSPVSLHPKYARYLVNTSGTVPGDTLLDPFCGTGGILIEAAMLGRKLIGNDSSLNMVMGTKLNFKYFGIENYKIYNKDITELSLNYKVDGIVTDMPYGRSSEINNHDIVELYREAFVKFNELLKSGGKCSIIVNNLELLDYAKKYFNIEKTVPVYQHKSLTRQFIILSKIN
ncbi:DNA methyltransferase [Ferroplasma sp.]|uniref:DNA methyltransferase n=1 Tax=Ferroplasma sp. TaxID=2591003 RepID=UPI00307D512B